MHTRVFVLIIVANTYTVFPTPRASECLCVVTQLTLSTTFTSWVLLSFHLQRRKLRHGVVEQLGQDGRAGTGPRLAGPQSALRPHQLLLRRSWVASSGVASWRVVGVGEGTRPAACVHVVCGHAHMCAAVMGPRGLFHTWPPFPTLTPFWAPELAFVPLIGGQKGGGGCSGNPGGMLGIRFSGVREGLESSSWAGVAV